jgi:hypothetical protein
MLEQFHTWRENKKEQRELDSRAQDHVIWEAQDNMRWVFQKAGLTEEEATACVYGSLNEGGSVTLAHAYIRALREKE